MAISKRYAVLNKNGVVVNHILIDDPMPKDYYPGYGQYLICLSGTPDLKTPSGLQALQITPSMPPQIGDVINVGTGQVFRFVPGLIVQTGITVSSAPDVKLEKDVEPTKGGG